MAGASAIGKLMIRLSRTRSFGGKLRYSMDIPTGVISPPPMPCTMRNTTSCCTEPASPQAADATVNRPTDSRKTSRAPNRSPSHPATGIATATATRKPMFTVAVSSTGTPKSAAMVGNATLTTVASMMLMNIAATNTVATAVFGLIRAITLGRLGRESVRRRQAGWAGCARHHSITRALVVRSRHPGRTRRLPWSLPGRWDRG